MKKSPMWRNAVWLMAGRVAQLAVNLLVGVLTARYLGPSDFGLIQYAAACAGCLVSLCNLGIPSVLVKSLGEEPEREGEILGTALVLQGLSSVLCALGILAFLRLTDRENTALLAVAGLAGLGMVLRIFEVLRCWFQSRQQCSVTALVTLGAYGASAAYKAVLLVQGRNVVWFALAAVVEYGCLGILFLLVYRKNSGGKLGFSRQRAGVLWAKSRYFVLPGLLTAVYAQADRILLKGFWGESDLGCYSAAVSLSGSWCFVLSAIIEVMYPEITGAYEDKERFLRRNRQLYALVFFLSMGMSTGITCLAEPLIGVLYGQAYLPAAAVLQILTWGTAFSYLGVARNAWVVCRDRQKYLLWVYAAGAGANLGLNLLLIPQYGAVGAALSSVAAQVVTAVAAPLCIPKLRENARLMLEGMLFWNIGRKGREEGP